VHIVYNRHYNISFFGIERLHPFDSKKYGRAWASLQRELGSDLLKNHIPVDRPVANKELRLVHSSDYLDSLRSPAVAAAALEIPLLRFLPGWLIAWRVFRPMKWAVRGSVIAAQAAFKHGWAVNLSGGYHHAKPASGEGFCIFSDIGLIVQQLRRDGVLQRTDDIAYIDLDAHQGNGVCHQFLQDRRVHIFDMYNRDIYPRQDYTARNRIDFDVPLAFNSSGVEYLRLLHEKLPAFLNFVQGTGNPRLAIYNAGTDVLASDKLGGLCLSAGDVLERDLLAVRELQQRKIPFVMLLSGGYCAESYRAVAATVARLIKGEAPA
jgi:histone deacetylase 11